MRDCQWCKYDFTGTINQRFFKTHVVTQLFNKHFPESYKYDTIFNKTPHRNNQKKTQQETLTSPHPLRLRQTSLMQREK